MTAERSGSMTAVCNQAVAVFGGTFDPVHYGHLRAAAEVAARLKVNDFRLVPAGQPPHRQQPFASAEHRLAMLERALAPHTDLRVDDREVRRQGPSYMVDTLASVRDEVGEVPLLLCLGQDAANQLLSWHHWPQLFELAHLVVMTRPDSAINYPPELDRIMRQRHVDRTRDLMRQPAGQVRHLEITQLAISSTDIRQQIKAGHSPRFLLPTAVLDYIDQHQLYRHDDGC